jgi:hypothetical protein
MKVMLKINSAIQQGQLQQQNLPRTSLNVGISRWICCSDICECFLRGENSESEGQGESKRSKKSLRQIRFGCLENSEKGSGV